MIPVYQDKMELFMSWPRYRQKKHKAILYDQAAFLVCSVRGYETDRQTVDMEFICNREENFSANFDCHCVSQMNCKHLFFVESWD